MMEVSKKGVDVSFIKRLYEAYQSGAKPGGLKTTKSETKHTSIEYSKKKHILQHYVHPPPVIGSLSLATFPVVVVRYAVAVAPLANTFLLLSITTSAAALTLSSSLAILESSSTSRPGAFGSICPLVMPDLVAAQSVARIVVRPNTSTQIHAVHNEQQLVVVSAISNSYVPSFIRSAAGIAIVFGGSTLSHPALQNCAHFALALPALAHAFHDLVLRTFPRFVARWQGWKLVASCGLLWSWLSTYSMWVIQHVSIIQHDTDTTSGLTLSSKSYLVRASSWA